MFTRYIAPRGKAAFRNYSRSRFASQFLRRTTLLPREIIELFFINHQASSIINYVSDSPSTPQRRPNPKPKTHSRGGHPPSQSIERSSAVGGRVPPDRLYTLQQQDMARIPRLEIPEPTSLRTNLPTSTEMYLWVSERNVAHQNATTRQNSRH